MRLAFGLGFPPGGRVAAYDPVAALLSLSPTELLVPLPQYLGPTETGLGAVASGGTVGYVDDLGSNAAPALQATLANRPLYETSNGIHWLRSVSSDFLVAGRSISQPFERVSAWRILTLADATDFLGGGGEGNFAALYVGGGGTEIRMYAGSELTGQAVPAQDTDFVVTERYNGAGSRIAIDNGSYVTGNPAAGNPTALTLFAGAAGSSQFIIARCYGVVEWDGQNDANVAIARTAAAFLQGRVL